MKRREWLELLGVSALLKPKQRARRAARAAGWRFDVDSRLRWRLSRGGQVLVDGGVCSVEIDGTAVALADLDAVRRFHQGGRHQSGWLITGRAGDAEITAEFADGDPATITLRARGLGARRALGNVTFFDTRAGGSMPPLRGASAWINGFDSGGACRMVSAAGAPEITGHWQLALLGGPLDAALSFGETDTGAGTFVVDHGHLAAIARCAGRAVAAELPPAACRLTLAPGSDPLGALGRQAGYAVARLPADVPSGWAWLRAPGVAPAAADVLAAVDVARRTFDRSAVRVIQVGEGYQRALGDWDTTDAFPGGHAALTDAIRHAGFTPGLWLAPFAVGEHSALAQAHSGWLLADASGAPVEVDRPDASGAKIFALDAEIDDAREHLRQLARTAVQEWGYQFLELDRLGYAAQGARAGRRWGPFEAYRAGMEALRSGATGAYLLGNGAPLQHALGTVDGMRTGGPVAAALPDLQAAARATLLRSHLDGRAWHNDPGPLLSGDPLSLEEARLWATLVALTGGVTIDADRLAGLGAERIAILQRAMPVLPVAGELLDVTEPGDASPALVLASAGTDRYMLAAMNWGEEPRRVSADLNGAGVRGPFATFDVWGETRANDVTGAAILIVPPRSTVCLALRRPRSNAPFVLGTTRHVVQGLLDLDQERWDARHRKLSGTSVSLDGRPYAITIAVPAGMHPSACSGSVACTVEHPHGPGPMGARTARLTFGELAERIEWEVTF